MTVSLETQSLRSSQYSEDTKSTTKEFDVVDLLFTRKTFKDLKPQKLENWVFLVMSPKKIFIRTIEKIKKCLPPLPAPASREHRSFREIERSLTEKEIKEREENIELINILQSFVKKRYFPIGHCVIKILKET